MGGGDLLLARVPEEEVARGVARTCCTESICRGRKTIVIVCIMEECLEGEI